MSHKSKKPSLIIRRNVTELHFIRGDTAWRGTCRHNEPRAICGMLCFASQINFRQFRDGLPSLWNMFWSDAFHLRHAPEGYIRAKSPNLQERAAMSGIVTDEKPTDNPKGFISGSQFFSLRRARIHCTIPLCRARRGVSGALYLQSAIAGLNPVPRSAHVGYWRR